MSDYWIYIHIPPFSFNEEPAPTWPHDTTLWMSVLKKLPYMMNLFSFMFWDRVFWCILNWPQTQVVLLFWPPKCWNYRHVPPSPWKFPLIKVAVVSGYIEGVGKSRTKVDETMNQAKGGQTQTQIEPNWNRIWRADSCCLNNSQQL